ncbi:hypothetical protein Clacol_008839 [Clathrus columnatus]|uniref:Uncharacterized protein n=1 Tax=Clathrus columnatus TaxID=1419009 RepID=A0AAV5APF6_9AGAM|nr:hypothetical protein Clacol_008839 [Clathrus columnatus]
MIFFFVHVLSILSVLAEAAVTWTATPLNPPAVPLAVRSPYLSAWLQQGSGQALNDVWPSFWTGMTLGWAGLIRVDGTTYTFLGAPGGLQTGVLKAAQKNFTYTSTQSTFILSAGPVDITVNFLSPIEPTDLVKQSLPFSYLAVTVQSTDGNSHHVQVYTDISAEWISGDLSLTAQWNTSIVNGIITHQVQLEDQTIFGEISDRAQYGSAFYSTSNAVTTFQSGQDIIVRNQFVSAGVLSNTQDINFRAINDDWPVFGFVRDFGNISSTPLTHGKISPSSKVGPTLAREMNNENTVVFTIGHVRDPLVEYITIDGIQNRTAYWRTRFDSVVKLIEDFLPSYSTALNAANALDGNISADALRISDDYEAIVELSVRQALGACEWTVGEALNPSDIMGFLKGSNYPKALGHNDGLDEAMPVEVKSVALEALANYCAYPLSRLSTDDFAGTLPNQTNLAIKGTIGIKAMSIIEYMLGNHSAGANYSSIATSYAPQIEAFATTTSPTNGLEHLELNYGNASSWGLSYNLLGDKLLGTNVFGENVFEMHWQMFTAAIATSNVTRDLLITRLRAYLASGVNSVPLSDWYGATDAVVQGFQARPVVGGHLALLVI